jgi:hypothetical protein
MLRQVLTTSIDIFKDDISLTHILPIGYKFSDFCNAVLDGVLLCKLINVAMPGTIDERVLKLKPKTKDEIVDNHNIFINSAIAIGCPGMQNMSKDLLEGNVPQIVNSCYEIVKVTKRRLQG